MLGYHGNEIRFYDELLGGKNEWRNAGSPNLHDLLAVRYLLLPETQAVPGFHHVLGPVTTTPGSTGVLLERDTVPPYVRVVPAAAKLPEDQVVATVIDPRFPLNSVVLLPDTASVTPEPIRAQGSDSTSGAGHARRMGAREDAGDTRRAASHGHAYLLISETWYPDWHAQVDGRTAPVHRGDHTLLTRRPAERRPRSQPRLRLGRSTGSAGW